VSFVNGADSTAVFINAISVDQGTYTLVLESFDRNSAPQSLTLKTDTVTI